MSYEFNKIDNTPSIYYDSDAEDIALKILISLPASIAIVTKQQYIDFKNIKNLEVYVFSTKERYKDKFNFDGNRAIVFNIKDKISVNELKHCISLSLTYHNIKHLPMLGV